MYPDLRFRVKYVVIIIRTGQKLAPINDASTQWAVVVILHVTYETFVAKDVITRRDDGCLGRVVADATWFLELVFDALVGDFMRLHGRPTLWTSVRGVVDLWDVCGLRLNAAIPFVDGFGVVDVVLKKDFAQMSVRVCELQRVTDVGDG